MLEQLFGSKTRVKLLRLFMNQPTQPYYLRELARLLKTQLNSVRREINNLEKIGMIKSIQLTEPPVGSEGFKKKTRGGAKKYYLTDTHFVLFPELKALLLKAELLLEQNLIKKIEQLANPRLFILTGVFVGREGASTDMLMVGSINKTKMAKLVAELERELGRGINYTVMSNNEYKYRQDITDRFLYDILEGQKIVMVDKTGTW